MITDYEYDEFNRLETLTHFEADGTPDDLSDNETIARFEYQLRADGKREQATETTYFDLDGNPGREEDRISVFDWVYDNLGRLTSEEINHFDDAVDGSDPLDRTETFVYDLASNREERKIDFGSDGSVDRVFASDFDANDRLISQTIDDDGDGTDDRVVTYGYTGTEQTSKLSETITSHSPYQTTTTAEVTHTYNLQGRLKEVVTKEYTGTTVSSQTRLTYEYDPQGMRIHATEKLDPDGDGDAPYQTVSETEYLIDAHNETGYAQTIIETTVTPATGTTKKIYTFGHDEITQTTCTYDTNGTLTGETTHTFAHDGHGSVRVLLEAVATIAQIYTYSAYGELLAIHNAQADKIATNAADALTTLLYSGETFDPQTGLQYLRARYYDPNIGRFNRLDPFFGVMRDPLSLHKHLYCHADPVNGCDASGQFFSLAGLSMASSIGTTMNQLTAMSGQSLATSLGVEMWADPLDLVLSRDIGILPKWVYDTIDSVGMFVMNHAGEIGVGATTFVLGAAFSRSKGSLGVRLKRYQDNIASKICQFGKSVIRRRMHKLEALGEGLILRLKKGAMQVSGEFDEPMKGTDLNFVKRFLSDKRTNTRFWLYRPKADAGLGDFVIIDMSDAGPGRAIALELKEKVHGFAGKQVTGDGHDLLRKAGFGQIDLVTATESQFYEYIEYITKPLGAGSHIL